MNNYEIDNIRDKIIADLRLLEKIIRDKDDMEKVADSLEKTVRELEILNLERRDYQ